MNPERHRSIDFLMEIHLGIGLNRHSDIQILFEWNFSGY